MLFNFLTLNLSVFVEANKRTCPVFETGQIMVLATVETAEGLYISSSNNVVRNSTILNFRRSNKRRMGITVGISYQDLVEVGLNVLKELALSQSHILKDPEPQVIVHMLADRSVNLQLYA